MPDRAPIDWGLTRLLWQQRVASLARDASARLSTLAEDWRRLRGTPPPERRAEVAWSERLEQWEIAPIGLPRGGPALVLREQEVQVAGDAAAPELVAALHAAFEGSVYLPARQRPPGLRGWTAYVREHRLVGASLLDGEIAFAPWVRVHQGRGGSYAGVDHEPVRVSASAAPERIAAALRQGLELARELETEW